MSRARRVVTVRKIALGDEGREATDEVGADLPPAERVELAWRLSEETYRLAGRSPDAPRLRGSPARVVRR